MKQLPIYGLLIISMIMVSSISHGQKLINPQTDSVKWEYGRGENKLKSESLSISGQLISYGGKKLLWLQNGTDRKYLFDIKSVKGEWSNIKENGELIYQATCNGVNGTVRIFRMNNEVGIQIDFTTPDKLTPNVLLTINATSKI